MASRSNREWPQEKNMAKGGFLIKFDAEKKKMPKGIKKITIEIER